MANNAYTTGADFHSCAVHDSKSRRQKQRRIFPVSAPLELLEMDILGATIKTKSGKKHAIVFTNRHMKLIRAIPVIIVTSTSVATVFVDNLVLPYGIQTYSLTDNGLQFVSKLFAAVTTRLEIKQLTTTAYHPRPTEKLEDITEQSSHTAGTTSQSTRPTQPSTYSQ